ncbi:MAG: CCA tRNA nucleotidyltransferase [Spirochaetaceae bacterium]
MAGFNLPGKVKRIGRILRENGFQCFLVGGAVRNLVMGCKPKDYDLATDAHPKDVQRIFHRVIPTGVEHGTVTVLFQGESFEVTTFRSESGYSDGRHPDAVRFETRLEADLSRRDFTMNGMAIDVASGELHDPFGGRKDIRRRLVRAIGAPDERLREDGLRVLRAFRFAAQLDFRIEDETCAALARVRNALSAVAAERVREELVRMLEAPRPSVGLRAMQETGVLEIVLPELSSCAGVPQEGGAVSDLLDHLLLACDGAPAERREVRLAALLHDIGKPETMVLEGDEIVHFHGHDQRSAELSEQIMTRLRFPTGTIRSVSRLVGAHMIHYTPEWSDAAVRRFIHRVGPEAVWDLILLQRADAYGKTGRYPRHSHLDELTERVEGVLSEESALSVKDLAVDGRDLQDEAGIPPGPLMGRVLDFLLDTVMEDPSQNERPRLLEIARNFYQEHLNVTDRPGS